MPITYTNRREQVYYLHQGKTKTGKPKYYASMKDKGDLAQEMPDGFEFYEHPADARVYLRKKPPMVITDIEIDLVKKYLKNLKSPHRYLHDIKGPTITIYESNQDVDEISERFKLLPMSQAAIKDILCQGMDYQPMMRFILEDRQRRLFVAERFCFRGSIDDWIDIGGPDSLEFLLEAKLEHLGRDSFYELF